MIQDIEPKKLYNQYRNIKPQEQDIVFCFRDNRVLLGGETDNLHFPEAGMLHKGKEAYQYLFSIDEKKYFLFMGQDIIGLAGFSYEKMFKVRSYGPKEEVFAASTAYHLYVWYRDNRFCGRCGKTLNIDEGQRMLKCDCGNLVFPKIAPAVIVGVWQENRLLMTRYANREYKRYALIAGFTEIGETPEQTVEREVFEEAGIKVKNIRYYKSQPWGFDSNLLIGFFAELDGNPGITMDTEELATAEWIERDKIELEQDDRVNLSLTREMMLLFHDEKRFMEYLGQEK